MVEIWVPYGPVEVSFDIKQENLTQILEPHPAKLPQEELEKRLDSVAADTLLLLSGSPATVKTLDTLLARNKAINKILHPKNLGALARRKAQEFAIQAELFDQENLEDSGMVDGSPLRMPAQVKNSSKLVILTSIHYDPMYGLSSAASDLISLVPELKAAAFKRSVDELPCAAAAISNASWYSIRALQSCSKADTIEVVEKTGGGVLNLFYGDIDSVHAQSTDSWVKNSSVNYTNKAERVIFGCGGQESDKTLHEALARAFFNITSNLALLDSPNSKICMLAECSQGLGSEALLRYATGRYTPGGNLDAVEYFDGLEVLISFYKILGTVELHLLSTLPKYFVERFDMKPVSAARDAPSSIVQLGSRAKILVVPDATSARFTQATEPPQLGSS